MLNGHRIAFWLLTTALIFLARISQITRFFGFLLLHENSGIWIISAPNPSAGCNRVRSAFDFWFGLNRHLITNTHLLSCCFCCLFLSYRPQCHLPELPRWNNGKNGFTGQAGQARITRFFFFFWHGLRGLHCFFYCNRNAGIWISITNNINESSSVLLSPLNGSIRSFWPNLGGN